MEDCGLAVGKVNWSTWLRKIKIITTVLFMV